MGKRRRGILILPNAKVVEKTLVTALLASEMGSSLIMAGR
jgi:hypothetical protein